MEKENDITTPYREYVKKLSREELIKLVIGDGSVAPLTRNEPTYSRPKILWGIHKLNKAKGKDLAYSEEEVLKIISYIEGFKYDSFYNYDFFTFEVKKPSFYVFLVACCFSLLGAIVFFNWFFELVLLINFIKNVIHWI